MLSTTIWLPRPALANATSSSIASPSATGRSNRSTAFVADESFSTTTSGPPAAGSSAPRTIASPTSISSRDAGPSTGRSRRVASPSSRPSSGWTRTSRSRRIVSQDGSWASASAGAASARRRSGNERGMVVGNLPAGARARWNAWCLAGTREADRQGARMPPRSGSRLRGVAY